MPRLSLNSSYTPPFPAEYQTLQNPCTQVPCTFLPLDTTQGPRWPTRSSKHWSWCTHKWMAPRRFLLEPCEQQSRLPTILTSKTNMDLADMSTARTPHAVTAAIKIRTAIAAHWDPQQGSDFRRFEPENWEGLSGPGLISRVHRIGRPGSCKKRSLTISRTDNRSWNSVSDTKPRQNQMKNPWRKAQNWIKPTGRNIRFRVLPGIRV